MPKGIYTLQIWVSVDDDGAYRSAGWYDGESGTVAARCLAFELRVDGEVVEDIEVGLETPTPTAIPSAGAICGVILGVEGQPAEGVAVSAWSQDDEEYWIEAGPDGAFVIGVPKGIYTLQIWVNVDAVWFSVGWHDGKGGTTAERSQAIGFSVDAEKVVVGEIATLVRTPTPGPAQYVPPTLTPEGLLPPIAFPMDYLDDRHLEELDDLRKEMPEEADSIAALPWVADGFSQLTKDIHAARGLVHMAEHGYLDTLIGQQWVIDGTNPEALSSLSSIGYYPEAVTADHPALMDGIDEQESLLITVWFDAHFNWSGSVDDLFDISKTTLEERTITLPLAGETGLAIIQHSLSTEWATPALEQAVRDIEAFMGYPFPARRVVGWLPNAEYIGVAQNSFGHYFVAPLYYGDGHESEAAAELELRTTMAHEVAHHYWRYGFTRWCGEGAAEFMASLLSGTVNDPIPEPRCGYDNIADWEAQYPPMPEAVYSAPCDYELGEALFRDLYQNMDEVQFRLGFRRLYLRQRFFPATFDSCGLTVTDRRDMCDLRESFTAFVSPEDRPRIEAIIDRWHYGEKP